MLEKYNHITHYILEKNIEFTHEFNQRWRKYNEFEWDLRL